MASDETFHTLFIISLCFAFLLDFFCIRTMLCKHADLSLDPWNTCDSQNGGSMISVLGQGEEGRDRQISGAYWPACLAESTNGALGSEEDLVSKNKDWRYSSAIEHLPGISEAPGPIPHTD